MADDLRWNRVVFRFASGPVVRGTAPAGGASRRGDQSRDLLPSSSDGDVEHGPPLRTVSCER